MDFHQNPTILYGMKNSIPVQNQFPQPPSLSHLALEKNKFKSIKNQLQRLSPKKSLIKSLQQSKYSNLAINSASSSTDTCLV